MLLQMRLAEFAAEWFEQLTRARCTAVLPQGLAQRDARNC
jgi:hypothetical protein